jgi:cytosine/adenosine deaminase-related metal-dependent hydrolase
MTPGGVTFINADMGSYPTSSLRIEGARIVALGAGPAAGDRVVDLDGDRLLPGLINAHDHLQLNHFPTLHYGRHYPNAGEWIRDFNDRVAVGRDFAACRASPRDGRLLLGGIKNLLGGVTTVAHHDPFFPLLSSPEFPTQVLENYGWSHSLGIDGDDKVRAAYRGTPSNRPWIIHAAEGVDAQAAAEFDRLEKLDCLGPNTLLVHGVALDAPRRSRLAAAGAGLIWCPSSNLRLFGATAAVDDLIDRGRVALGNDSRLTGSRDLLEEIRVARDVGGFDEQTLESLVTDASARLLRLNDRGVLAPGARADLLVLPARMPLSSAARGDLRLVMSAGSMRCGDLRYAELLMPDSERVALRVDGNLKIVSRRLGALLSAASASEPGVERLDMAGRAA